MGTILLGFGLDLDAFGLEIATEPVIVPSRIDIILGIIKRPCGVCRGLWSRTRHAAGYLLGGVGSAWSKWGSGVGVSIISLLGEEDELFFWVFWSDYALIKKEVAKPRLVPFVKGRVANISKGALSRGILIIRPCSCGIPVLFYEMLKGVLRGGRGDRNVVGV
jgi:hypothetical protein